jgi:TolB-like protein/Flp pilus assembly protein TadD
VPYLRAILPKVTDVIKARRSITLQSLRSSEGRVIKTLSSLQLTMTDSRSHLIVWFTIVLMMFVGLVLVVFLRSQHQDSSTSASQLPVAHAPERSIAVLPFESLSDNKSDTYFADGVQDEILSNLAKVSQLKVISRTSVMTYRPGGSRNLRSIANALGVANVVEGTVRRDGHWIRVTTALIDARTDQTLWSDSYDRDLTGIFAIQSEIAKAVASKLSARLSPEERQNIRESPTEDLEAYDLFLQAKELMSTLTFIYMMDPRESVLKAIALLEEATRKDPQFALAYCLLANAHDYLYSENLDKTAERRALGDAAVNQALHARPDLPEVHLAAAFHRYACYRDYDRARLQIAIAQRSLPNSSDALALAADLDRRQGRWSESTTGLEKAAALDPRNPELLSALAENYFAIRRYLDYEHTYDQLIELEPDKPLLILQKAYSEIKGNGDWKSYRAVLDRLPSSMEGDAVVVSFRFAYALAARNWTTAKDILSKSTNGELYYFNANMMIPRGCLEIWIDYLQGGRPAMESGSTAAREQLNQKVQTYPEDATILSTLGVIDAALGRNEEAVKESERAVKMVPVSEDAVDGPSLVYNLAAVYGMVNERDLAFQALNTSAHTPGGVAYGELKLDPAWDPLRNDPRFDKLLVQLAPHN